MPGTGDDYFPATTFCPLRPAGRYDNRLVVVVLLLSFFGSLSGELHWQWFPLGSGGGALSPGIILTAVITGLVNISNTYGAIRGTDVFYPQQGAGNTRYRRSFVATGFMTLITVPLAVIPFSPFVSSIGLLTQTGDYTRRSFIYGSVICLLVALVPALTRLFCSIPLPVSSAVMLVSYLPLLFSALVFSQQITFTARNIYHSHCRYLSAYF